MANHCVFILLFFHLLFLFFDHFYGENEKRIVGKFICTCVCVVFFLTKRVTLTAKILMTTGRKMLLAACVRYYPLALYVFYVLILIFMYFRIFYYSFFLYLFISYSLFLHKKYYM